MKKNNTDTLKGLLQILGKLVVLALAFVTLALFFCKSDEMRNMIFSPAGIGVISLAIGGTAGFFAGHVKCMFEANEIIDELRTACEELSNKLAKSHRSLKAHKNLLARYEAYLGTRAKDDRELARKKFMAQIEHFPVDQPDASEASAEDINILQEDESDDES